jgi:hypothetical protein
LIGVGRDLVPDLAQLQRGLLLWLARFAGVGERLVDVGFADRHVAAEFFPHHVLPYHLRPDAIPESLDVHAHLAERCGKLVGAHIVVFRHAGQHLVHVVFVRRQPELSPLLYLQALLDQHVRGLFLQGRRRLFLGRDGEKPLALLDVVDGDRIVVDEHDNRLLGLRLRSTGQTDQPSQYGKQRAHRNAGASGLVQIRHHC